MSAPAAVRAERRLAPTDTLADGRPAVKCRACAGSGAIADPRERVTPITTNPPDGRPCRVCEDGIVAATGIAAVLGLIDDVLRRTSNATPAERAIGARLKAAQAILWKADEGICSACSRELADSFYAPEVWREEVGR